MDAVFQASGVPVHMMDVEVPTHNMEVGESKLLFKQVNNCRMVGIRVDVGQKSSIHPDPQSEDQDISVIDQVPVQGWAQGENVFVHIGQNAQGRVNIRVPNYDRSGGAVRGPDNFLPFP